MILLQGDCLDLLPTLEAGSVDAAVCSPPYAMQRAKQYGGIPEAEYPAWTVAWLEALRPALTPRGSVLINIREHVKDGQISDYVHRTRLAVRAAGWIECDELIWIKPNAPPVGHPKRPRRSWERVLWFSQTHQPWCDAKANGRPSLRLGMMNTGAGATSWVSGYREEYSGIARGADYIQLPLGAEPTERGIMHPAAYPVALAVWMLQLVTPPNGTGLDPFMGSGTTGVACITTGRDFIGMERDPGYFSIAQARIAATQPPLLEGIA